VEQGNHSHCESKALACGVFFKQDTVGGNPVDEIRSDPAIESFGNIDGPSPSLWNDFGHRVSGRAVSPKNYTWLPRQLAFLWHGTSAAGRALDPLPQGAEIDF
jgi:hypothetical protein